MFRKASLLLSFVLICLSGCGDPLEKGRSAYRAGNYEKAAQFLSRSAQSGSPEAKRLLGLLYYRGLGVAKDHARALTLLQEALAAAEDAGVHYLLGNILVQGGVPRDYARAAGHFRKASEEGHARAAYFLGIMLYEGRGVAKDRLEGTRLLHRAAELGEAEARAYLKGLEQGVEFFRRGEDLFKGLGGRQDYALAFEWFRQAAERGEPAAFLRLGWMYERGLGVPADNVEAFMHYSKAESEGVREASASLAQLRPLMSPEEKAEVLGRVLGKP